MIKALLITMLVLVATLTTLFLPGCFYPDQSDLVTSLNATVQQQVTTISHLQSQLDNYACPECPECLECPECPKCPECPPYRDVEAFVLRSDVEKWLRQNDVNKQDYKDSDQYAIELQQDALEDGYIMSVIVYKEKACPGKEYLMCQVILGQTILWIDPTDDEVTYRGYLP